jgi:hypothetical protein
MIGGMKDARAMALRLSKWLGEVSPNDAFALKDLVDYCDDHYPKIYGLDPWEGMPEQLKRQVCELVAKLELARRGCTPAPGESLQKSIEHRRAERADDMALIQAHLKTGGSSRIKVLKGIGGLNSKGRGYLEHLLKEIKEKSN